MKKFVEYMEIRQEESKGVDHIISTDSIKVDVRQIIKFREKVQTVMEAIQ